MKNDLGDRIKTYYENRTRLYLPRRTYTIIRIDGKAFHTYTKKLNKPFDSDFIDDMNETAIKLCEEIQGAKMAYVQSDEISILLSDFDTIYTDAWFDGNVQKITSISASIATAKFNNLRLIRELLNYPDEEKYNTWEFDTTIEQNLAYFDSRVFTIPSLVEVENYFIWRQKDAVKNSISCLAQSLYSHKELLGKNSNEKQEMCFQKGQNWNNLPISQKRGSIILKQYYIPDGSFVTFNSDNPLLDYNNFTIRTRWVNDDPPIFTQDKEFLKKIIPKQ